jgi:hypothetical protein
MNIEMRKKMSLEDWKRLCESGDHKTPTPRMPAPRKGRDFTRRSRRKPSDAAESEEKQDLPHKDEADVDKAATEAIVREVVAQVLDRSLLAAGDHVTMNEDKVEGSKVSTAELSSQYGLERNDEVAIRAQYMPDSRLPPSLDLYKELERNYWKNLTFIPPIYGADM